ncbi:GtrA family protein [uncultured Sphingomonas sp.]|uniref:GtrA family protein n=1 Tax=uncultured Sphingomonas sp. TaxID=158754 RepID=UPI0025D4278C|nr:GtrA family protein [uncultured Sphingomonas sp.]
MLAILPPERRAIFGQLLRFLVSGGIVTALGVGVYALVALGLRWHPQLGNFLAYVTAAATGYLLHSRWSFRDHGGERGGGTLARFVTVSLISLGLNSFWVWLLTEPFRLSPAWPIVPMLFVTPLVTFTLNRQWVFR